MVVIEECVLVCVIKGSVDIDVIIRVVEVVERRYEKEIRGMVMQMEWFKVCWDWEVKLRKDVVFVKKYLFLEVQIRDVWYVFFLFVFLLMNNVNNKIVIRLIW